MRAAQTREHHTKPRCTSAREAKERLEAVLESMGGIADPEYEPGLDPHQRAKEDNLRAAIAYLQTLDGESGYVGLYVLGVLVLLSASAWAACEWCLF